MSEAQSQGAVPVLPSMAALSAYAPDGQLEGFLAAVAVPGSTAQLWMYQAAGGGAVNGFSVINAANGTAQWWLVAKSVQQGGGFPADRQLATRCGATGEFNTNANFTNTNFLCVLQTRHVLPYGADRIRIGYAGWALVPPNTTSPPQEAVIQPAVWSVGKGQLTVASGGTGYAVGDTITGPTNSAPSTIPTSWVARVSAISGSAITKLQVIKPGIYTGTGGPPADGMSQSATSGGGSAATFNAQWDAWAGAGHICIQPAFTTQTIIGAGAIELASQPDATAYPDMSESWDFYIPVGGLGMTDPIPVDIPPGGAIGIRGEIIGANMQCGRPAIVGIEYSAVSNSFFERANGGVLTNSQANQICQPACVIGVAKVPGPVILAIADSRLAFNGGTTGTGSDTMDTLGSWGWFERACGALIPYISYTRSAIQMATFINGTPPASLRWGLKQLLQKSLPTAVFLQVGINDFIASRSSATVLSWEQQFVAFIRSLIPGVQVFTETNEPNTTSSDAWATVGNQTITGAGTQLALRNAALRAGGYGSGIYAQGIYDFFLDWQGVTEYNVGGPSGKWVPNATADGLHQTQTLLVTKGTLGASSFAANLRIS